MKIIFATANENKVKEVRQILPSHIEIVSLKEMGYTEDIEETGKTLEENSLLKAQTIYDKYQLPVLAEDTGLEVDALQGAPGVYSARYAGEHGNSEENMSLLLKNLEGKKDRKAQFRTVATFIVDNTPYVFSGVVRGEIIAKKKGTEGFGYDPIFIPAGFNTTFAEMTNKEKGLVSHRGIAISKFAKYFEQKN